MIFASQFTSIYISIMLAINICYCLLRIHTELVITVHVAKTCICNSVVFLHIASDVWICG